MSLRSQYLKQRAIEDATAPPKLTEVALGEAVVAWLSGDGWKVYQEVKASMSGDARAPIADIVAVRGPVVWIIECKKVIGLEVLDQLLYWYRRGFANYFSAATFGSKTMVASTSIARISNSAAWMLKQLGFGDLYVNAQSGAVNEAHSPALHRQHPGWVDIRQFLHEDQCSRLKAGSKGGNVSTPFQRTCDRLRELVAECGEIAPREAIERIDHHYQTDSSARSCLIGWASRGNIRGVRVKREGRAIWFARAK